MRQRLLTSTLGLRLELAAVRLRRAARLSWRGADREAWLFVGIVCLIAVLFSFALRALFAYQDERREAVRQHHQRSVHCLALNVYFEARGEPLAGQFAVAEVTMNRASSPRFPETVCEVVYQKSWDTIRGRYVGAFSWTELDALAAPSGLEWDRARRIAEAVYYRRDPPALKGALYFHATYIEPSWAKEKRPVARIGRHVFYK